jgi:hypothetical protein
MAKNLSKILSRLQEPAESACRPSGLNICPTGADELNMNSSRPVAIRVSRRSIAVGFAALLPLLMGALGSASASVPATASTYFVSCVGNDANGGQSGATAWRTLTRANKAVLRPGDSLVLMRGCAWNGERLDLIWAGTVDNPIHVGAYGDSSLPRPLIRNGSNQNVKVTGSYLVIDSLQVKHDAVQISSCGQPIGSYVGFNFKDGATHNTLTRSRASGEMAGVNLASTSNHTRVIGNELIGNNVMKSIGTSNDLGAWGMLVGGNDNEVASNLFQDNRSVCKMSNGRYASNSVELYAASRNAVHHNRSINDRVFSELGSSSTTKSSNNSFADNVFSSTVPSSRFITTRGALDATYGPVLATSLSHNTAYQTGSDSQGVVCSKGCDNTILSMRGNVLWAETKVIYADAPLAAWLNILWSSDGTPTVQDERRQADGTLVRYALSSSNMLVDPRLENPATGRFLPTLSSPALDRDGAAPPYPTDFAGTLVPQNAAADVGSLERPAGG